MKEIGILIAEWVITGLIAWAGFSGKQVLFINSSRSAAITLGTIGFAICMLLPTIGKFISNAPAHPLTIAGYFFGAVALFAAVAQIFRWKIPIISDPSVALIVIVGCIVIKSVIGRFAWVVIRFPRPLQQSVHRW